MASGLAKPEGDTCQRSHLYQYRHEIRTSTKGRRRTGVPAKPRTRPAWATMGSPTMRKRSRKMRSAREPMAHKDDRHAMTGPTRSPWQSEDVGAPIQHVVP